MVNTWLPEPPQEHTLNSVSSIPDVPNGNQDVMPDDIFDNLNIEEDETNPYDGYQPLPNDPFDEVSPDSSDEDIIEDEAPEALTAPTLPPIVPIGTVLVSEVWSEPRTDGIEMDAEKENEVKQAMMNFTLPASSIPEWAANIPEDQWKQTLKDKIQSKIKNNNE